MIIDTNNKIIYCDDYILHEWGHVKWMIQQLERNAELLFGEYVKQEEKKSATILKLVDKE